MAAETIETTFEMVDLREVQDNPSWATDPDKVAAFRRYIQQGKRFAGLLLRRVWHDDATWHYEILDGFHRYRALHTEGVEEHPATVIECDDRTANYDRAQASLDKPSPVLRQRALQAIREGFTRDMIAHIENASPLERTMDEDGIVHIVRRADPAPADDAVEALLILIEHQKARRHQARLEGVKVYGAWGVEEWEETFDSWVHEMCQWFGAKQDWLLFDAIGMDKLAITPGVTKRAWMPDWRKILNIPDRQIRKEIMVRYHQERAGAGDALLPALTQLGMGPDLFNFVGGQAARGRTEILSMLAKRTLGELAKMHKEEAKRRRDAQNSASQMRPTQSEPADTPQVTDAVFSVASPHFVASASVTEDEKSAIRYGGKAFMQRVRAHGDLVRALQAVRDAGARFEQAEGDWADTFLQQEMRKLANWLEPRMVRQPS